MAALKDIKRKISAVQKTRQITKAMNMVAASKFKSAQMRMDNFRPYAIKFMDVMSSLALRVDASSHPLLAVRPAKRIRIICMTSDRGLCGGFNTNLIKTTEKFIAAKKQEGAEVSLVSVGRKGRDSFRKKEKLVSEWVDQLGRFTMNLGVQIGDAIIPSFLAEEYDELYLIYNEFRNVSVQGRRSFAFSPCRPSGSRKRWSRTSGSTISTSHRRSTFWTRCSGCTSTSCSTAHFWKQAPERTAPGWPPWTMPRRTARS